MSQPNLATTYQVLGPGSSSAHLRDMEAALKVGSRMIALPLLQVNSLRRKLHQCQRACWGYGFDEVWIEPRQWVRHYGRWYSVLATFKEAERDAANRYMSNNERASVLCVMDGIVYLAHTQDEGVESLDEVLGA